MIFFLSTTLLDLHLSMWQQPAGPTPLGDQPLNPHLPLQENNIQKSHSLSLTPLAMQTWITKHPGCLWFCFWKSTLFGVSIFVRLFEYCLFAGYVTKHSFGLNFRGGAIVSPRQEAGCKFQPKNGTWEAEKNKSKACTKVWKVNFQHFSMCHAACILNKGEKRFWCPAGSCISTGCCRTHVLQAGFLWKIFFVFFPEILVRQELEDTKPYKHMKVSKDTNLNKTQPQRRHG